MDSTLSSSPDPLNNTPTFSSPAKPRVTRSRKSLTLQDSSPTKQTFQLDIGDQMSPQKIRVTVEAEPSARTGHRAVGKKDGARRKTSHTSPIRQSIRTTTTTIPLKGLSDIEQDTANSNEQPPKRGRGRPRKSTGTPIPSKALARPATPAGKQGGGRRRTLGDLVDGDDPEDWDFAIGDGVEIGRGKGRPRSRSTKKTNQDTTTAAARQSSSPGKVVSNSTNRTALGGRKALNQDEILIHEDDSPKIAVGKGKRSEGVSGGVFASRDLNTVPTQSAASTIRSTTTVSNDDPDILLAKFSPARHTLAKTGWSSPSIIPAPPRNALLSGLSKVVPSSPAHSFPEDDNLHGVGDSEVEHAQMSGTPGSKRDETMGIDFQESDTVLEEEGFSMISVDSVPSLREHLSSPSSSSQNEDISKSASPNASAEQLRSIHDASTEDSFSVIAPEILHAATPRKRGSHQNLLTIRPANKPSVKDSLSDVPSEVLQTATPAKPLLHSQLLGLKPNASNMVEDSFSSIPSAILESASPAKHQNVTTDHLKKLQLPETAPKATRKLAPTPSQRLAALERPIHKSAGLTTPDETPSPTDGAASRVGHQENQHFSKPKPNVAGSTESSVAYPPLRSSPPSVAPRRYTYTAHLRQQRLLHPGLTQTPSIVFSSPTLPPLVQNLPANRKSESTGGESRESLKEKLSPIVRAGRVLQDMTTSPSSRIRSLSLGSPFKSQGAHCNQTETSKDMAEAVEVSEQSENSNRKSMKGADKLFGGFGNDTRRELRRSMMIGEELAKTQESNSHVIKSASVLLSEDPFSYGRDQQPLPSPEKQSYTLGLPKQSSIAYPSLADALANKDTIRSEGVMSWQAEYPIEIDVSSINARNVTGILRQQPSQHQRSSPEEGVMNETTELLERRREAEWARERARVSSEIESASASQVVVISSDAASPGTDDVIDDLEEDIWQAEARDSSLLSEEPVMRKVAEKQSKEKPRRSKIPSSWRQNSKRLTYSDEVTQSSSPSQSQSDKSVTAPVQVAAKAEAKPIKKSIQTRAPAHIFSGEELSDSSAVWPAPQKLSFAPMPRKNRDLNVSELLASPLAILPQLSPRKLPPSRPLQRRSKTQEEPSQDTALTPPRLKVKPSVEDQEADIAASDDSQAESESESFHTPGSIRSPRKSSIRTPTAKTPTKSVTFTSPTPSPPLLSGTEWSRDHWALLQQKYYEAQHWDGSPFQDPARQIPGVPISWDAKGWVSRNEIERVTGQKPSKLVGRPIRRRTQDGEVTHVTVQTKWHHDIVAAFVRDVPGWDDLYVMRRLFSLFIGEEARRDGTIHLISQKQTGKGKEMDEKEMKKGKEMDEEKKMGKGKGRATAKAKAKVGVKGKR